MSLIAFGINHKVASLDTREKLSFNANDIPLTLQDITLHTASNEAVLLSTCNRTEIYTFHEHFNELADWLCKHCHLDPDNMRDTFYCYEDIAAVEHIMQVACGLDSMVVGEPQILGQLKHAYHLARDAGTLGPQLNVLFQNIFATSKQVRHSTGISDNAVSIAYAALQEAKSIFSDLSKHPVLCIGSGDTIELCLTHLQEHGCRDFIVASRNLDNAQQLANASNAKAISLHEISEHLSQVDIVISATASELPLLGKGAVESAIKQRKHRPMVMLDLAVPRDIEPEIAELEDVYLYNLDHLQQLIEANQKNRMIAAEEARKMIELHAAHYMRQLKISHVADVIADCRNFYTELSQQELQKALRQLAQGQSAETVLAQFANQLTNKFLHQPTVNLRQAAASGDLEQLHRIQKTLLPPTQKAEEELA